MFIKLSFFASALLAPIFTNAQVDPSIDWKTMHLPHFELVFDARHQDLANIYAARLEGAQQNLSLMFPPGPGKTTVVMDDRTDLTNGSATTFPYPLIMVYPVLPAAQDSIGEYSDWAAELVTHEYAHVLAMNPQRGVVSGLSYIFGNIMMPNLLLPNWWHEGLAVEMETRFSTAGRLRSPIEDAWLRSYAADESWNSVSLAQANELGIPTWPYGARPYLIGSVMWSEMMQMQNSSAKDLSWSYGGRFPYLINQPALDILGMYYRDVYKKTNASVGQKLQQQLETLQKVTPSLTTSMNLKDLEGFSPSISPDGLKMAFIGKDETTRRSIRILERPNLETPFDASQLKDTLNARNGEESSDMKAPIPHDEVPGGSISRISWLPNSDDVVFDRVDELNWFHETSDLYLYNITKAKVTRLSRGLRAREPALSPDGEHIVFVQIFPGKTELGVFDISTKTAHTILVTPLQSRCSYPSYVDATRILFSYRENGVEGLKIFDLKTNSTQSILTNFPNPHFAKMIDGHLLFASTKNGVYNLYLSDREWKTAKPITHTLTGIFESDWDFKRNEYYLSEQTSRGVKLSRLETPADLPENLPTVRPLFEDRYPAFAPTVVPAETIQQAVVDDYSPWSYLLPRYWIPMYNWDSFSSYLSASTSSQDPLGKHIWSAFGQYDLNYQRTGYEITYQNGQTPAQILSVLSNLTVVLPGNVPETTVFDSVQIDWQLADWSPYLQAGFGWSWLGRSTPGGANTNQAGPSINVAYANFTQSGAQVSPESGMGGSLNYTSFLAGSSQLAFNELQLSFVKYWSSFLPKRHALMTKFQSYYIDQPIGANYAYTSSQGVYANTILPQYLMRGYAPGAFQGRVLNNLNLEYRFPLRPLYVGWDTSPIFLKRLYGVFVVDGANVDGYAYDSSAQVYRNIGLSQSFWSAGAEGRIDTTLGYKFGVTVYGGIYTPVGTTIGSGFNVGFGLYL
jgi:Tol biopolymer transport system component